MNDLESLPGWITVTEQGIKQSFDMTRVMFCRGNITEKMRFGQLVQANEVLLDMYAGIGYYTLPALILGMAKHVIACEWNKYAAQALRYNIFIQKQKPSIDPKRVTVWQGDCRQSILSNLDDVIRKLEGGGVDRISLGLLPSSEGGWPTAVSALRIDRGGWLHIHGNVPTIESLAWAHWTCQQLFQIVNDQRQQARGNWIVICHHIERVKSFAPKIDHYVADIFVGTRSFWKERTGISSHDCQYGVLRKTGDGSIVLEPCPQNIKPPSCALSKDGALCQKWMM